MRALICLLFLAACGASPAPQYFGATRSEVVKGGITFVVFHKDNRAEVVRLGYLTRRERAAVPDLISSDPYRTFRPDRRDGPRESASA